MAEEAKGLDGSVSWPAVAALIVGLAGAIWYLVPFSSSRPSQGTASGVVPSLGYQDVPSRLWQDPFEANQESPADSAEKLLAKISKLLAPTLDLHSFDALKRQIREVPCDAHLTILPVMLEGGPYADRVERRRRMRNAMLAGLNRAGYAPRDQEHIGYVTTTWPRLENGLNEALAIRSTGALEPDPFPLKVPYEWCEGAENRALVLWLNEEWFSDRPLRRLALLLCELEASGRTVRIIGPWSSTTVQKMVDEVYELKPTGPVQKALAGRLCGVEMYTATATAPIVLRHSKLHVRCEADADDQRMIALFSEKLGMTFQRTISRDDYVLQALVDELKRRGVEPKDRDAKDKPLVILFSEWDTDYGRRFAQELELLESGYKLTKFSYLRGLDGSIGNDNAASPNKQKSTEREKGGIAGDSQKAPVARGGEATPDMLAPEGPSQYDYLRRLSAALKRLDETNRLENAPHGGLAGVRAIGVVGSDVYDKLLVLQALRSQFPRAIFFTTDLEARLGEKSESKWARNLVVASAYGLELKRDLQADIPPFRDSYQTALFCTVQKIMGAPGVDGKPVDWSALHLKDQPVRRYEIGVHGAVELPQRDDSHVAGLTVHPELAAPFAWWRVRGLYFVTGGVLLAALVLALFGKRFEWWGPRFPFPRSSVTCIGTIIVFLCWSRFWPGNAVAVLGTEHFFVRASWRRWLATGIYVVLLLYVLGFVRTRIHSQLQLKLTQFFSFSRLLPAMLIWVSSLVVFACVGLPAPVLKSLSRSDVVILGRAAFAILPCGLVLGLLASWQVQRLLDRDAPTGSVCCGALLSGVAAFVGMLLEGCVPRASPRALFGFASWRLNLHAAWALGTAIALTALTAAIAWTTPSKLKARPLNRPHKVFARQAWRFDVSTACYAASGAIVATAIVVIIYSLRCQFKVTLGAWLLLTPPIVLLACLLARLAELVWNQWKLPLWPYYVAAASVLILVVLIVARGTNEVPFVLLDGVSLWGTELVRVAAAIVALHSLVLADRRLRKSISELTKTYCLHGGTAKDLLPVGPVDAADLWAQYRTDTEPQKRRWRRGVMTLAYVGFSFALYFSLGLPESPHRGPISHYVDRIVYISSEVLLLWLTFYVVDAARVVDMFVRRLGGRRTAWPPECLKKKAADRGMPWADLDEYLDIRFIASMSEPVVKLLYDPLLVLSLMICARLQTFANWDWPVALMLVLGINSLLAIYSMIRLRASAERVRKKTIESLEEKQMQLSSADDGGRRARLGATIKEIRGIQEGAFATLLQSPIVRALVLPLAAIAVAFAQYYLQSS
jgi:hypothetical protein